MTNLLPKTQKQKILRMYRMRYLSVSLGLLALIAVSSTLLLAPSAYFLGSGNAVLREKLATLTGAEIGTIATKQAAVVNDINSRLNAFQPNLPASPLVGSMINPVLAAKTADIRLTDFSYVAGKNNTAALEIRGVAKSREALLAFGDALRNTPSFSNVTVPIENFIKGSNITFSVEVTAALK